MDVVKSIRGMTTDDESVFVKMMDSQKIAGTSVSTTNYPMTNHVGDRRTHGALCTGTYLCHVHTVAYDPWITWITGSRRWTRYWSKWVFCCSCKPPQLAPNEGTKRREKISVFVAEVVRHFFDYKLWFLLFLFLELFDESYASSKFFEEREGKKRKRFGTMMGTSRKYRIGPQ